MHILNPFLIPAALTDKSETFLEKGSGNKNNGDFKQSKGKGGESSFFTLNSTNPTFVISFRKVFVSVRTPIVCN